MSLMPRLRLVPLAGALVVAAAMTGTTVAHAVTESSDTSTASVLGNPTVSAETPSEVSGPIALAGPPPTPAPGPTPEKHVYLSSRGGEVTTYGTVRAPLEAAALGARITAADVTFTDDPATGENVSAETAALQICRLSGEPAESTPDAPITYDCTNPVTGKRTAAADGSGTWTFHLPGAAHLNGMRSAFMFGIVPAPADGATSTVAIQRESLAVDYTYVPKATVGSGHGTGPDTGTSTTTGGTGTPAGLGNDSGGFNTALPVSDLPVATGGDPIVTAPLDPVAAPPASGAYAPVAQAVAGPGRNLRPLLLLVLPVIPMLVMWGAARIGLRRGDDDIFPDLNPA